MTLDPDTITTDQTVFATEEPLFNADGKPAVRKGIPPIFFGIALLLTLGVIFFSYRLLFSNEQVMPIVTIATPSPTPRQDLPRIERLLKELKTEIDLADPTTESLAFPPVSEEVFIEE